jgi:hypothetical protein
VQGVARSVLGLLEQRLAAQHRAEWGVDDVWRMLEVSDDLDRLGMTRY